MNSNSEFATLKMMGRLSLIFFVLGLATTLVTIFSPVPSMEHYGTLTRLVSFAVLFFGLGLILLLSNFVFGLLKIKNTTISRIILAFLLIGFLGFWFLVTDFWEANLIEELGPLLGFSI